MNFDAINKRKKELGLNNAQIADRAGITLSTMDKITSGANQNPKLDTLFAIADVLGLTLDDFDDRPKQMPTDILYISRPTGIQSTDELRKQMHDMIDQLEDEDLRLLSDVTIRFRKE